MIKAGAAKFSKKFLKSSAKERFARNLSARYNQVPYDPKNAQNLASELFGSNKFTRSTVPVRRMPNVRLAGQCKERTIIIDPETQETLVQRIVFDNRGFPIFDPYVKVETRITGDLSKMSREAHMRMAARQLRRDIEEGKCLKGNLLMLNGMTSSQDLKK